MKTRHPTWLLSSVSAVPPPHRTARKGRAWSALTSKIIKTLNDMNVGDTWTSPAAETLVHNRIYNVVNKRAHFGVIDARYRTFYDSGNFWVIRTL